MAIRFRCQHCQTLQSIATRKAGTVVKCASCDQDVLVPAEDQADIAGPQPALQGIDRPAATNGSGEIDGVDRVALPDDFFDFVDEETPRSPAEEWEPADVEEPVEFTAYDAPAITGMFELEPSPAVELPPLRSRSEEIPEQFALPIRKSNIDDEMDLTPMVDVVFQLLIFFMVTASFALHKTIQTPTPDPDQKGAAQSIQTLEELEGVAILVRIDGQNAITIDDEPLPDGASVEDALVDKMRQEQKSEIIITADAAAWHRTVVKVVDAANAVGMQKIRLATRSGPEE